MIHKGTVAADGTLDEVRKHAGGGTRYRIELEAGPASRAADVGALPEVEQVSPMGSSDGFELLEVRAPGDPRTAVARLATTKGWQIRAMERHVPSLEEAFLAIVGRER